MTLQNQSNNNQQTRDELSSEPDVQPIYKIKAEKVIIEFGPEKTFTKTLGNSWIVGSSTNGLVGTNTSTEGGGQQVVGASGRVSTTQRVTNVGNSMRERFNFTTFEDTGVTTADWADTVGLLKMTNTEIAQSESVALNTGTITQATMTVTFDAGVIGDLTLQLAADGSTFETVTNGTLHSFTATGTDLKFKITASGTVDLSLVQIDYE